MKLYERVLAEIHSCLGDKGEQFLIRQCQAHIHIAPQELTNAHLPELARWVKISASLIVSQEAAQTLRLKIEALATK